MKKFLAVVLAAAMAVSVAACGNSGSSTASTTAAASSNTSTSTSAQAFKFGSSGPLTGAAAIYGKAVMNAINIAVEEVNAAGGINGYQVEFKAEDDVADGETAVNAYNSLIDWGMQVMIGTVTTGACISMSAVAQKDRTFCLTPSASSVDVTAGKDCMYQLCFTDPNQGTGSADYIAEHYADKTIAVIYRNDDAYSQGIRDTFVKQASAKGLNVAYEGTFTEATSTDFSVQLTAAQAANCDLVFLPIYYQPASVILNQANQMGYAPTFFGVDGMDGILAMEGFDTSLAEGVMLLTPFAADAKDERVQAFVAKYKEKYGETPNQFAADGYDCVYAIKTAIEKAGCTPADSREAICEALVKTMQEISYDGITGAGMTWSASGEVTKAPAAVVIKDGAYVTP
ncbi:MAG: ABC transporter substrate-binding protein [Eubacteriales bacterium]|nr:ABC transporter substrate-binding protein [Eubacteriales bacterium]